MSRLTLTALSLGLFLSACAPATEDAPSETPATPAETAAPETSAPETAPEDTDVATITTEPDFPIVGYPDGWELQPYWSGEYPNAFSVTQEGVTVMAHPAITFEDYPPIYCGLPHKATYSPWNAVRRESDALEFVAMVYPTTFTIKEDAEVEAFIGDSVEMLSLKAGDELIYKSYLAEGFFIAEKDGIEYELNESELPQSTEFGEGPEDQEWVLVTCADAEQTRAWVLYEDALRAPGVEIYEYTSFGEAADLP